MTIQSSPAQKIIDMMIKKYRISRTEFFSAFKDGHLVEARMEAAKMMHQIGIRKCVIARLLKRDYTTVSGYLNPRLQRRKHGKTNGAPAILRILDPDVKEIILSNAQSEKTTASVIIAKWVSERARGVAA